MKRQATRRGPAPGAQATPIEATAWTEAFRDPAAEWLEADGLGGFASGCASGVRTRRYHALLLTASRPPAGRIVLVNGFDASIETANGNYALSSQLYPADVVHPDGTKRIIEFEREPWPKWIFALEDGTKIEQQIFAVNGASLVALSWRLLKPGTKAVLTVTPFLSGRDYHSMHHENRSWDFLLLVQNISHQLNYDIHYF